MLKVKILFIYIASLITSPVPRYEVDPIPQIQQFVPAVEVFYADLSEPFRVESVSILDSRTVTRVAPPFTLPVDWDLVDQDVWTKPHHDYPALDVKVPVGTPVYAIREGVVTQGTNNDGGACGGTVVINTDVGQIMYCHLSQVVIQYGASVRTGQLIGYSGGKPGTRGAGSSTTPHVHIGILRNGRQVCPQPLLASIAAGSEPDFTNTTRCY